MFAFTFRSIHAHFRANDIAVATLYLVGSTVAYYLLAHPNHQ